MKFYAIQQAERVAEIFIFGDIYKWRWSESDTSAWSLVQEIKDLDVDVIHVHVDSYGGDVSEGWAIYNALREHKARIVTYADGYVASAAIYPFMAGDERIASSVSAFFFHEVQVATEGNADELRRAADLADLLTDTGINALREAGVDGEKIERMIREETWITGQQAYDLGIATEIRRRSDDDRRPAQSVRGLVLQKLLEPNQTKQKEPQEPAPRRSLKDFLAQC